MSKILTTKPAEEVFLSSKELMNRWKCHSVTLQRWVRDGKLPAVEIGGKFRRYRLSDILRIEAGRTK